MKYKGGGAVRKAKVRGPQALFTIAPQRQSFDWLSDKSRVSIIVPLVWRCLEVGVFVISWPLY